MSVQSRNEGNNAAPDNGWRNTATCYGSVAKYLHWIIALLFLGSYSAVKYRHWFTEEKTPENWSALQLHLSFGVTIMVFVALRVFWRLTNPKPDDLPAPALQRKASHIVHWALYAVMIYMPLTGFIGTHVNTEFFGLFEIPMFEDWAVYKIVVEGWLGLTWKEFETPIDYIHIISGAWIVWVLILIHAGAALYHHYIQRDDTLKRMLLGNKAL